MLVKYATDIIFGHGKELATICEILVCTAMHAVKTEILATFLGRKLYGKHHDERGNDFQTSVQGTRITHMGKAPIGASVREGERSLRGFELSYK
jgi:hypothetical protein